ncbi:hypothetical protein WN73_18510 [Bradyrhizobium sp. CCBAU 45394]|uniref:acyltransferase family protein n=1 Tax=Bradyrhizobium sp. CCBAU 45394 TaxID=1325087 RepID=UPI002304B536|nr:acyltransferase family protein [Bradyrhizobium sp. CCBAU 45394]MDA9392528.1 hypothetical protein [Bradyrhizobium sp. CCBAU 45394]
MAKHRADIQALRGIAVGLVVLDHFKVGPFHHGFLGVDIFFVVSGFLITQIIAREIDLGQFTFAGFYARRAKRILPAAYVTILLTSIGAIWFLDSVEMASLTIQVWGAITYTINFVLWQSVGYFDVSAGFKPLLHLWSLAIEEQFYLLFPALLVLLPKERRLPIVAGVGVASFIACLCVGLFSPTAAFYLLPTRAWELMLGALGALAVRRPRWLSLAYWPGLAAVVTLPIVGTGTPHPGIDALIICCATLTIVLGEKASVAKLLLSRIGLVKLGDISYSLYLVHWPVVVFMNDAFGTEVSMPIRATGMAISIALAFGLYLFVEQPSRRLKIHSPHVAALAILMSAVIVSVQVAAQRYAGGGIDTAYLKRPNHGLDRACDNYVFENKAACRTSDAPTAVVWGDSYAMVAASGARYYLPEGLVQATYSACPPFIGYAPYNPTYDDPSLIAKYCIAFNDGVERFILQDPQIRTVILAASFWQYTKPDFKMMRRDADGAVLIEPSDLATTEKLFFHQIERLKSAGKEVVVVEPPPGVDKSNLLCSERAAAGKMTYYQCDQSAPLFHASSSGIEQLMQSASQAGATIVRLADGLCNQVVCHTLIDGVIVYRDSGHLSYDGARKVFDILAARGKLPPPFK